MKTSKIIKIIIILVLLWVGIHIAYTVIDGITDDQYKTDVGIVLGNKVEPSGQPSERLQSRLDKAIDLYNQNYFENIIVSGGIGAEGFNEATVMKIYLVDAGIPAEAVIEDDKGINTISTARNAKEIMDQNGYKSALVISQYFHLTRTKMAMHRAGVESVYSAHAEIVEFRDVYSLIREFFGFYSYLLK